MGADYGLSGYEMRLNGGALDGAHVEHLVGSRLEVWGRGAGNTRTGPAAGVSVSQDGNIESDLHNGYHAESWGVPPSPLVPRAYPCLLEAVVGAM